MKDGELLRLLRRDPYEGMQTLCGLYAGMLYTVVRSKLPERFFGAADAEDIVADTLSAFYLNLDRFKGERCSIRSYLCIMARNRAVDRLRAQKNVILPLDEADGDDGIDIAQEVEEKEMRGQLLREIKALGEPDSAILIRKYYLGESSAGIALSLGMSVSNVDTRTCRAIRKLRKILTGESK